MFCSLSKIRGRKSFSLVLDIPPRHPYSYTSFKLEGVQNNTFHFLLFSTNSREILGFSLLETELYDKDNEIIQLLCKCYKPLHTNITTQTEIDRVRIEQIKTNSAIGFGGIIGRLCLVIGLLSTIAITYRRMCRH